MHDEVGHVACCVTPKHVGLMSIFVTSPFTGCNMQAFSFLLVGMRRNTRFDRPQAGFQLLMG
jgi:hypothetical protein